MKGIISPPQGFGLFANNMSLTAYGNNTITTSGESAVGAYATTGNTGSAGLIFKAGNAATQITTSGNFAIGVNAVPLGTGTVTLYMDTVSVTTTGGYLAIGINVSAGSGTATATLKNTTVTTGGVKAHAVYALDGGSIDVQGGNILTTGDSAYGLVAWADVGSQAQITSVTNVTTKGTASHGVVANDGIVILNGGVITTKGAGSHGLYAVSTTHAGHLTSVANVSTSGDGSHGAYAQFGKITLNGGTLTTTGDGAHGLYTQSSVGNLTATGVTVSVSGAGAAGIRIQDSGGFSMATSHVTSAQGNALWSTATAGLINTATITGSTLSSTAAPAMVFDGGTQNFTLAQSKVTGGNGGAAEDRPDSGDRF